MSTVKEERQETSKKETYVNGSYKGNNKKALSDLIHDFFCTNPADMRHRQLAKRVSFLKETEIGVRKMSKIIDELLEEAREEARKETLLDNIRSLTETLNLTAKQAMDALKVPADKQKELLPLI